VRTPSRCSVVAVLLIAVGVAPRVSAAAKSVSLTVLFTSDMHARVASFDEVRQAPSRGSIAQVASLVARVRSESPHTVVLDGGDAISGTPLSHYALVDPDPALADPTVAAMNLVSYDAAVLGNHEFDYGVPALRRATSQARFPWLAANLDGTTAAGLAVGGSVVLRRGGLRVVVLGLTTPATPRWVGTERTAGLSFRDPVEEARRRLAELRRRADLVIVVLHAGFERDLETGKANDSAGENFAWRLAQLPGIDLLLTGHTHRDIPPQALGKTVVAQPGRWAEKVSRVDLVVERRDGHWTVTGWRGENLLVAGETEDPRVMAATALQRAAVRRELARPLGRLERPLAFGGVATSDDAAMDVVHAVQLEASGAELSLASPLGNERIEFAAGALTPRLAHALYPYANTLVVVRLTGGQVREVLEHAQRGFTGVECGTAPPCIVLRDPDVPPYGFDTLQGATYVVDATRPAGKRVVDLRIDGRAVDTNRITTLAINSYRAAGGGDFPHLAAAPRVARIDTPMVDLLVAYLERRGSVTPAADGNWWLTLPFGQRAVDRPSAIKDPATMSPRQVSP
jgi:2',3'-cyclic-nucleotide 2'-phosphodiesterase (5'-nucleotidase family)